jgi:serralysin
MAELFHVTLTGDQELPSVQTQAHGEGTVRWDPEAQTATYHLHFTGVDFSNYATNGRHKGGTEDTVDDVINLHTHNAPRGYAGPVVFGPINPVSDADDLKITYNKHGDYWDVRGVWETTDPAPTSIADFATILNNAPPGDDVPLYFNVHTTGHTTGEIRGQWVAIEDEHHGHGHGHGHGWGSDAAMI